MAQNSPPADKRKKAADRRKSEGASYLLADRRSSAHRRLFEQPFGAHRLAPAHDSRWLPIPFAILTLQKAFPFVDADEDLGYRYKLQLITRLQHHQRERFSEQREQQMLRLSDPQRRATYVRFGENPTSATEYLDTLLLTQVPLVFRYESAAHRDYAVSILERVGKALGYNVADFQHLDMAY